jgi:hypothetical protein
MGIIKGLGRIVSAAANLMACVQGMCFKPDKESGAGSQGSEEAQPLQRNGETAGRKDRGFSAATGRSHRP